jgi:hypothetical protein
MVLTKEQLAGLESTLKLLELANGELQAALGSSEFCYDLVNKIEDVIADIEFEIEETV